MYCAWCGTQVPAVSVRPCSRCGKPTNGTQPLVVTPPPPKAVNVAVIIAAAAFAIVIVGGIVAAIAIPKFLAAIDRTKQKKTMEDLHSVATALEKYATDNNAYPKVQSYEGLAPVLTPTYIGTLPVRDGWDHLFRYACSATQSSYAVASDGKDGLPERELPEAMKHPAGATTNFDCDIVYSDGRYIEYPEGVLKD